LEPNRLKALGDLAPHHFASPFHEALYAAMRSLTPPDTAEHGAEPLWPDTVLRTAAQQVRGLTTSYVYSLLSACPTPEHAATYAHMVRADHTRRILHAHAERLALATTDPTLPHPVQATMEQADALTRYLDHAAAQLTARTGTPPRPQDEPLPPRETSTKALEEEQLLLATATAHPSDVLQMRWLQPEDFTHPLHAALFQCQSALAHRGDPLDPITVLWEAKHRGLLTGPTTPDDILTLVRGHAGSPEYWGEKILQRSVLHCARTTAQHIQAYTNDPASTPHQLITGSRRALADLTAIRIRWRQATAPPPAGPAASTTPKTIRAGPARLATTPPAARRLTR
jgi:replicative DNA helicase